MRTQKFLPMSNIGRSLRHNLTQYVVFTIIIIESWAYSLLGMTLMAAKALEFLESAIQKEKQHYIGVINRSSSNTIEVKWTDLMGDCDDNISKWFSIFLFGRNRRLQLEQSSDITFYSNGVKRKVVINLSSPMASVTTTGSHVSMDNLLGIDFGFWPLKPILETGTPEPINDVALRKNGKKRDLKPFSHLK